MDEHDLELARDAFDRARPALAEVQRVLASVDRRALASAQRALESIDRRTIAEMQRAGDLITRDSAAVDQALRATAPFGANRLVFDNAVRAVASLGESRAAIDQLDHRFGSVALRWAERAQALGTFDVPWVIWEASRALRALDAAIADLHLSPEWEELLDDLSAADDANAAIEGDFDVPVMALAAGLAVPALIERIKALGADDAAWRLEREDTCWRTTDDDRVFPMIIHGAVSVLEEVARQIAGSPEKNLQQALKVLRVTGTITKSEQQRMLQVWTLRSKTPGAGHGIGRAPKEVAGFVLLRVRRGLLDLLNAVDAEESGVR